MAEVPGCATANGSIERYFRKHKIVAKFLESLGVKFLGLFCAVDRNVDEATELNNYSGVFPCSRTVLRGLRSLRHLKVVI
jgi:hypothetical protein